MCASNVVAPINLFKALDGDVDSLPKKITKVSGQFTDKYGYIIIEINAVDEKDGNRDIRLRHK